MAAREATRSDLPWGMRMSQCPMCWRMFSSDGVCESHKPYSLPRTPECKDPSALGLVPVTRRGIIVWSLSEPDPAVAQRLAEARLRRSATA